MSRLRRAEYWLPLALLALTIVGQFALAALPVLDLSQRDWQAYGDYRYWQLNFDALSAVTGVGLLMLDIEHDYTAAGRWVLALLGLSGALLYLAALWQVLRRIGSDVRGGGPTPTRVVAWFLGAQLVASALCGALSMAGTGADSLGAAAWQALSVFASLGWVHPEGGGAVGWLAAISLASALFGWIWLGRLLRWSRLRVGLAVGAFLAVLVVAGVLLAAFEQPRGPRRPASGGALLSDVSAEQRLMRSVVQVALVSGAGMGVERIDQRGISEGGKLVLALVIMLGGAGGGVAGGVTWLLVVAACGVCPRDVASAPSSAARLGRAGRWLVLLLGAVAVIVAGGLLLIETGTGSPYQAPPTLGDALLDAASAVGGANLSGGVVEAVTAGNLSSGIRHSVDQYQYGMTWLMAAMLIGRLLPVLVIARVALVGGRDAPTTLPPRSGG